MDMLLEESPKLGLEVNPGKCEWSLDPMCKKPCPISVPGGAGNQIVALPTDVPWAQMRKLQHSLKRSCFTNCRSWSTDCLFDDIQSAFFLLRTSFSIVRATHFMRTTPRAKWRKQAKCFFVKIWDAAQSILGLVFSEQTWKQACLTPRLGGLGLRKIEDHADIAFSASWRESKATCREDCWSPFTEAGFQEK